VSRIFATAVLLALTVTHVTRAQDAAAAFSTLKALAGDWQGTYEWTGERSGFGVMNATYYVTANGTALVENLTAGGVPSMTSVYHLDGADLRMTHYCGAGNQPRLKAGRVDLERGTIDFDFVDVTNLPSPDGPHVHGVEMRLIDRNHLTLVFLFRANGRESRERIALQHAERPPA